jgi:hypothetical protein
MDDNRHEFADWAKTWMEHAQFVGPVLPGPAERVERILRLWDQEVPGEWRRGRDPQLHGPRYRRSDINGPPKGEHLIEHEILCQYFDGLRCLGQNVVDGMNAMPLAKDENGGRTANVEADMLLLLEKAGTYTMAICEVKGRSNNVWHAAVENLRQIKLLAQSSEARALFHRRRLALPPTIPFIGLIIAPSQYYLQRGKRSNAVSHAAELLTAFTARTGIEVHLACWDSESRSIDLRDKRSAD